MLVAGNDTLQTLAETTTVLALTAYVKVPASVTYDYAVIQLPSEEQPEETKPTIVWHPYPAGYQVTNMDLLAQFVEDTVGQTVEELLTGEQSAWKWLGDYVLSVDTTVAESATWEQTVSDFFNAKNAFETAGQPASWDSLWWNATFQDTLAHGATMPKVKRHGWILEDWRYGNEDGYYYFSNESKVINNQYDTLMQDSLHIWARWIEQRVAEDFELYSESGDTSAIDLRGWLVNTNDDLMLLIHGQNTNLVVTRTLIAGKYNAISLPFAVTPETIKQVTDSAGNYLFDAEQGGKEPEIYLYDLANVVLNSEAENELQIQFHLWKGEEIPANMPFVIKPQEDIETDLVFHDVIIVQPQHNTSSVDDVQFRALLTPSTITPEDGNHIIEITESGVLQEHTTAVKLLGLNGYFVVTPGVPAYDHAIIKLDNGLSTSVDGVERTNKPTKVMINQQVYILQGKDIYNIIGYKQ